MVNSELFNVEATKRKGGYIFQYSLFKRYVNWYDRVEIKRNVNWYDRVGIVFVVFLRSEWKWLKYLNSTFQVLFFRIICSYVL